MPKICTSPVFVFNMQITTKNCNRLGRMFGRVLHVDSIIYVRLERIPLSNTKQFIHMTKYALLHESRIYTNIYIGFGSTCIYKLHHSPRSSALLLWERNSHFVFCRFRHAPNRSTGPIQMKSSLTFIRGIKCIDHDNEVHILIHRRRFVH